MATRNKNKLKFSLNTKIFIIIIIILAIALLMGGISQTAQFSKANINAPSIMFKGCEDSDGLNLYTKGTCIDRTGNYVDSCLPGDVSHILEWSCKSSACIPTNTTCASGSVCVQDHCEYLEKPNPYLIF